MMEAYEKEAAESSRRSRYRRSPPDGAVGLTPKRREILLAVARYGLITSLQLPPATERSYKSCQRGARDLFDAGWIEVVAAPRSAVAEGLSPTAPELASGSAPNLYRLTAAGRRLIEELGEETVAPPAGLGRNAGYLFLRHELFVSEFHLFLERCARRTRGLSLRRWAQGTEAEAPFPGGGTADVFRPDCLFVLSAGETPVAGFGEMDRGTERGDVRWKQKIGAYGSLFSSSRLRDVTGYQRARLVVVTPDARRRDRLAELIFREAPRPFAERVWLGDRQALEEPDLSRRAWIMPGSRETVPFLPGDILRSGAKGQATSRRA
jgi:hypothetical protein